MFLKDQVKFLSHVISRTGITSDPEEVPTVKFNGRYVVDDEMW